MVDQESWILLPLDIFLCILFLFPLKLNLRISFHNFTPCKCSRASCCSQYCFWNGFRYTFLPDRSINGNCMFGRIAFIRKQKNPYKTSYSSSRYYKNGSILALGGKFPCSFRISRALINVWQIFGNINYSF